MTSMKYRPDIDGLRTLAVLPVVLYHAGATWLPGGFVGVDIFFVISGYLISSIILREVQADEFSFFRFYERRIRRIAPALLVVVITTVICASFVSLPDQAVSTAHSAIAALLSVSNFWFWSQSGYFSTASEFMPLLHTWSLAVEEQFYIIFPIIIVFLVRLKISIRLILILGIIPAFYLSFWLSHEKPSVAFYLLPARMWELGLGAILAAGVFPPINKVFIKDLIALAGLFLLVFGMFYIDSSMNFPGVVALIPCLGSVMIIYAAREGSVVWRLLSLRPMVFIGLISYSLYLWHWPIFTLMRLANADINLSLSASFVGVLLSFFLAVLTWRFVERPFRSGYKRMPFGRAAILLSSTAGLIAFVSVGVIATDGLPQRLGLNAKQLLSGSKDTKHFTVCPQGFLSDPCVFGDVDTPIKVAVIGDSHAPVLQGSLDPIANFIGGKGVVWWHSACPMLEGAWREGDGYRSKCLSFKDQVIAHLNKMPDLELVILVGGWSTQLGVDGDGARYHLRDRQSAELSSAESLNVFRRSLSRTLDVLEDLGLRVIIIGSPPGASFDVPRTLALADMNGVSQSVNISASNFSSTHKRIDKVINGIAFERPNIVYIPVWDIFCPETTCAVTQGNTSLYSDSGHISGRGMTDFLAPTLIQRILGSLSMTIPKKE